MRVVSKFLIFVINFIIIGSAAHAADKSVAAGEALYKEHCETCHGEALRNPGSSFDLKELRESEVSRFERSVLGGKGQMPPWKGVLSPQDLASLWDYIRDNAEN